MIPWFLSFAVFLREQHKSSSGTKIHCSSSFIDKQGSRRGGGWGGVGGRWGRAPPLFEK